MIRQKIWFTILPLLAVAIHFFTSGILIYGVYELLANVFGLSEELLVRYSRFIEIFINAILILIFFFIYRLAFRKDKNERKTVPSLRGSLDAMETANQGIEGGSALELILIAVVAAPLLEELLFRGIVFRSMRKVFPVWIPVILSVLMFGAYHMNMVQAVYATFMGIVAAIIYDKTNHLMYPILVHAANNLIGAVQSLIPSPTIVFIMNLVTVIMIIPMCGIIFRLIRSSCAETPYTKKALRDSFL